MADEDSDDVQKRWREAGCEDAVAPWEHLSTFEQWAVFSLDHLLRRADLSLRTLLVVSRQVDDLNKRISLLEEKLKQ